MTKTDKLNKKEENERGRIEKKRCKKIWNRRERTNGKKDKITETNDGRKTRKMTIKEGKWGKVKKKRRKKEKENRKMRKKSPQ